MGEPTKTNFNINITESRNSKKFVHSKGLVEKVAVYKKSEHKVKMTFPRFQVRVNFPKFKAKSTKQSSKPVKRKDIESEKQTTGDDDGDSSDSDVKYSLSASKPNVLDKKDLPAKRKEKLKKVIVIPKSNIVDTNLAKQLLAKAKSEKQKKVKVPKKVHIKQFILPAVSSRSSRKIIPNKRFFQDSVGFSGGVQSSAQFIREKKAPVSDDVIQPVIVVQEPGPAASYVIGQKPLIKHKATSAISGTVQMSRFKKIKPMLKITTSVKKTSSSKLSKIKCTKALAKSSLKTKTKLKAEGIPKSKNKKEINSNEKNESPIKIQDKVEHKSDSVELITDVVEGKRERKPSSKLLDKWNDEDATSPSKAKPPQEQIKKTKGKKCSFEEEMSKIAQLEQEAQAKRRSGKNILQKAKLRLNQAALNQSKAALAKSLEKEMRQMNATTEISPDASLQALPMNELSVELSPLKMFPVPVEKVKTEGKVLL